MTPPLTCRWCDWRTPAVWTDRDGRIRTGERDLVHHIQIKHADEYAAELEQLEHEMREAAQP